MKKTLFSILIGVGLLSSCTGGSGGPEMLKPTPDEAVGSTSPMVGDRLALEAGLERIVYHVGPVDLPAGLPSDDMMEKPLVMNFQTDKPVWAVAFSPKVVDKNGEELPKDLLHIAIVSNRHEENPLCAEAGGNPFMVTNELLTEVSLPEGYGYPIMQTDPIEARIVLKNPTDKNYIDVYFEVTLVVKSMGEFANLKDVRPMYLEPEPCSHGSVAVSPGDFVEVKADYAVPVDAKLVYAHGVVGDYGASVGFVKGSAGESIMDAQANLNGEHGVESLNGSPLDMKDEVKFKEGETVSLTAIYNNTSKTWISDAVAGVMMYVAAE